MIKVLQFPTLFAIGGTERQVMNLARGLDPARFEVHFACLKRMGQFVGEIERSGRPLTEYPVDRLYGARTWRRQAQFASDLRRRGIDLVQTYGFWTNVFGIPAARLAGTPVVLGAIRDNSDHLTAAQRRVQRMACRLADGLVVNADSIKRGLAQEGFDPERIAVIRNGIDLEPFRRPRESNRLRGELGLPPDAPVVAMFARLAPVKGIEYFLEAARIVTQSFPAARFLVVGEARTIRDGVVVANPYAQELEGLAERLGLRRRVLFTGVREDVPALLAEVTVAVSPSLNEGLSNSVLEAMAAGAAVVATTVGGSAEAVEDGVTGLLVPPRDPHALARAIGTVLADPALASRFGGAARERVTRRFSIEEMVRQTSRLYSALLAERAPRRRQQVLASWSAP